jgi:hypothetical protein
MSKTTPSENVGGKEAEFQSLFNLAANGYLVVRFTLDVQVIGAHWQGGRLEPGASLKAVSWREISPLPKIER